MRSFFCLNQRHSLLLFVLFIIKYVRYPEKFFLTPTVFFFVVVGRFANRPAVALRKPVVSRRSIQRLRLVKWNSSWNGAIWL